MGPKYTAEVNVSARESRHVLASRAAQQLDELAAATSAPAAEASVPATLHFQCLIAKQEHSCNFRQKCVQLDEGKLVCDVQARVKRADTIAR